MSVSKARRLLAEAAAERDRLRRHLLVAAALGEVAEREPIVVGGTAELYYTAADYHQTDLDLVGWVTEGEERLLVELGFTKEGRHWFHGDSKVAVEFPEGTLAGDEARVERRRIGSGRVAIVGVDDLYLDRVRQATAPRGEKSIEFNSALAVAAAAYDRIDWRYVQRRLRETEAEDPVLGASMRRVDSKVRRAVRRALA